MIKEKTLEKLWEYGGSLLMAVLIFIAGMVIIKLAVKITEKALARTRLDRSVHKFIITATRYALYIVLAVVILTSLKVPTAPLVTLLGACAFRVLWIATVFQVPRFHTPEVVYWSYPISWALTFLTHLVCYLFMLRRLYRREGLLRKHHHLTHPQEE